MKIERIDKSWKKYTEFEKSVFMRGLFIGIFIGIIIVSIFVFVDYFSQEKINVQSNNYQYGVEKGWEAGILTCGANYERVINESEYISRLYNKYSDCSD